MTTQVKLRQKPISGNRQSLYLDFYPPISHPQTGLPTRREFLGLYLMDKSKNPIDKQHNKETMQLAQQIRQKRDNELNKPEIYTGYEKEQLKIKQRGETCFIGYFKTLADKRKASNHDNWISAYHFLNAFTKGQLKFADLNEKFCNDFRDYLLTAKSTRSTKTTLSQNSAHSYFNKLKAALKQAYKDGYLQTDLNAKIEPVKQAETQRNFLTLEELNALAKTECTMPLLKQAALFSALTGLRFSDIEKLLWSEIEYIEGQGFFIHFKQKKTKGFEVLPISRQAYSLLGERKEPRTKVFDGLYYSAYSNQHLYKWLVKAGISKDITFHCFRHTFATLQLSKGTDIYTVSKMLGHRELKTTQIYAKIIDQTKREAADKIILEL
ncbi:site-specific integrase [Rhodocytophaga rosea]|uniref:Site-specific integrase n=1 Tax=Rhodocytophaga rosea TaxID=2704465 RepID=A0A6C0GTG6_9BACT|nr:site-specific integrase [Rhodocytophaga rosea]QHT71187.1 site-specific integrase [Rhodocytophaga rosea]